MTKPAQLSLPCSVARMDQFLVSHSVHSPLPPQDTNALAEGPSLAERTRRGENTIGHHGLPATPTEGAGWTVIACADGELRREDDAPERCEVRAPGLPQDGHRLRRA